jgi:hypothetical protein
MVAAEVTGDTGIVAAEAEDANQGNVILTLPTPALDRYLRIDHICLRLSEHFLGVS